MNTEKITDLNKEQTNLNDHVQKCAKTASLLEENLKKMESKYEEQTKMEDRMNEEGQACANARPTTSTQ